MLGVALQTPAMAAVDDALAKFGRLTRGDMAPEFKAVGGEGKDVKLSDFRGHVVLVAFCNGAGPRDALLKRIESHTPVMKFVFMPICRNFANII